TSFTGWTRLPYERSASILSARLPSTSTTEKRVNGFVWFGSPTTFHGACGAPPAAPNGVSASAARAVPTAASAQSAAVETKSATVRRGKEEGRRCCIREVSPLRRGAATRRCRTLRPRRLDDEDVARG